MSILKWSRVGGHKFPMPSRATRWSAGYDLYWSGEAHISNSLEDTPHPSMTLYSDDKMLVPTGWAVEIPEGHVGLLKERSSLAKQGVYVRAGVIDSDYRGEIMVLLSSGMLREYGVVTLSPGQRIAQLLVLPCHLAESVEVPALSDTVRGTGGFGSTGV